MFEFKLDATDNQARAWEFFTEHWSFQTPIFMPVWTKATVKWIHNEELDEMKAQIILNNTYHLYLRPGQDVVKHFGWAHKFMNYNKPMLTDSGWFQVFSLGNMKRPVPVPFGGTGTKEKQTTSLVKITEEWVHFRSFIDWSKHYFCAENVMDIQSDIWADIIMAFDECAPGDSSWEYAKKAMERTHRWAIRSLEQVKQNNYKRRNDWIYEQALFPIVQWVVYDDLRIESTKFIWWLDTPWIAIWWLSVWETKEQMYHTLDVINPYLPKHKPRYLMWVWTPEDLIEAIDRWIDMFDCVLPTRLWRHATAFTHFGSKKVKNLQYKFSEESLDSKCDCKVCRNYSMWYLRHIMCEDEMLWMQLLSYHNLYMLIDLTSKAREAIIAWKYSEFKAEFRESYKIK